MAHEVLKSYKFRWYPRHRQVGITTKTFGCNRFLWNNRVANFLAWTPENEPVKEKTIKEMKEAHEWLSDVPYNALEQKLQDWIQTKNQYFSKTRKKKLGKPKFKKKGQHESFRLSTNG